ncbi:MAG: hypothetical protein JW806_00345 [Sedimentisphaerales bacterium]|nr:hypothetical protein [Sedimentisphaerales bacterium]
MDNSYRKLSVIGGIILCLFSSAFAYSGGTGEPNDPYRIANVADINELSSTPSDWGASFIMVNDINFNGSAFDMIGTDWESPFEGIFDGNGHTISDFNCSVSSVQAGLFGCVGGVNTEIRNVTLSDVYIKSESDANSNIGALVRVLAYGATINECSVYNVHIRGGNFVGGLAGSVYSGGTVSNCRATVDIESAEGVGGLIGTIGDDVTIKNCAAEGYASATDWGVVGGLISSTLVTLPNGLIESCYANVSVSGQRSVGGLIGENAYPGAKILNCYSTGAVTGYQVVGGLVGFNENIIIYCYSTGAVSGAISTGGLVGSNHGDVVNSYWDINSSGIWSYYDSGAGKTTEEMKSKSTYIGWGCYNVWTINDGNDYPRLAWQNLPGQPIDEQLSDYMSGDGSPNEPYLVNSPEDFNTIGLFVCDWDKHFKLMADINFPTTYYKANYNIIGVGLLEFTGVFDGNYHKIMNIYHGPSSERYAGLFGCLKGDYTQIKSLWLVEPVLSFAGLHVGGLAGLLKDGEIHNCHVEGGLVEGDSAVGGIVACNEGGTITHCSSSISTHGRAVGGIAGSNSGLIEKSYAFANASANSTYSHVGGLVGGNSGTINYCYSTGSVDGKFLYDNTVGGLVGIGGIVFNSYSHTYVDGGRYSGGLAGRGSVVVNCYSTGAVIERGDNEGGLIGYSGSATNSFWDIETSGQASSAAGTGLPTVQMQQMSTYTDAGWDFSYTDGNDADWFIQIDEYPILTWQISPADIYTDGRNDFRDFSVFAQFWLREDCSIYNYYCDWADLDFDGDVDINDLAILMDYWLQRGIY